MLRTVVLELEVLGRLYSGRSVRPAARSVDESGDPRFGYGVNGDSIYPAFALLLERHRTAPMRIASALPELSIVDNGLWSQLRQFAKCTEAESRAFAIRWIRSPARRLAWDIELLDRIGHDAEVHAIDVLHAVGDARSIRVHANATRWPALYSCSPTERVTIEDAEDAVVVRALRALGSPEWLWTRSQAICALLQRAATQPVYNAGAVASDLREELPARFGAVLKVPDDDQVIELERELLRVAVALTPSSASAAATFALARWIGYVLVESPFHTSDYAVLAAQLSSVRKASTTGTVTADDMFHPRRLLAMLGDSNEAWREFAVCVGAARHYLGDAERLEPAPGTLIDFLRDVAARTTSRAETDQEEATDDIAEAADVVSRHVAPTWIARAVLHRSRSSWLSQLSKDAFAQALESLDRAPSRYSWLAESIALAAQFLSSDVRQMLGEWWLTTPARSTLPAHQSVMAAMGAIEEIDSNRKLSLIDDLINGAEDGWRPFLAHSLATEARRLGNGSLEKHFVEELFAIATEKGLEVDHRQRALAWWVQRIQANRTLLSVATQARLETLVTESWVRSHDRLHGLVSQLGVTGAKSRGGSRR